MRLLLWTIPILYGPVANAFVGPNSHGSTGCYKTLSSSLFATPLPNGLSPFEKSLSKSLDLQGSFRNLAQKALGQALRNNPQQQQPNERCWEIEFPPLLGGDLTKTQFGEGVITVALSFSIVTFVIAFSYHLKNNLTISTHYLYCFDRRL